MPAANWFFLPIKTGLGGIGPRSIAVLGSFDEYAACRRQPLCHAGEHCRPHSTARSHESTDWRAIVEQYERLFELRPSPVVALNHAAAIGMAEGESAAARV